MKKILLQWFLCCILITLSFFSYSQTGGVSINKTNAPADPSAILDVSSTAAPYMGMLIPRMSTANRNTIIAPATGLQIFNTDCGVNEYYTGTCWISMNQNLKEPKRIVCSGTTDFCANENRTFTIPAVTGATDYDWMVPAGAVVTSGHGTTTLTVAFGNNSGQVCVSAENLCETSPTRCVDIHINQIPPTPGNITGPTAVVPNSDVSYFIAFVVGAGVYNWTVPAGATITSGIGTTTIQVHFSCNAVSGNVSVNAQSNCGTSSANTLAVTVSSVIANAGPSISGHGTIGGSPTASGGTTPYTYSWTPSANLSGTTLPNPSTTACTATTYTVTVTDAIGCSASSAVTVNNPILQLPSASTSPNPVCEGTTLNISTTLVPAAAYSWTGPNGFISTVQNPSLSNVQTTQGGSYTVTATVNGCSATSSTNVTVDPIPSSAFSYSNAQLNTPVTFTPSVSGAAYSWTFAGGSITSSTAQNPTVTWSTTGNYNVTLTLTQNGCSSSTTVSVAINNVIITFTNVSTTSWTAPSGVTNIKVLVVAGGGGGGCELAGGGGGGGVVYASSYTVIPGNNYSVTVGAGGAGGNGGRDTDPCKGVNGSNSQFDAIVALGGGGGGIYSTNNGSRAQGNNGGSGGGGGSTGGGLPIGGTATQGNSGGGTGYGNNGGNGYDGGPYHGGGGGGAGAAGNNSTTAPDAAHGGDGITNYITGSPVYYGGGGGGGSYNNGSNSGTKSPGGAGGGGAGGLGNAGPTHQGTDATSNTGGGGGGAAYNNSPSIGGNGGSGIVIIAY